MLRSLFRRTHAVVASAPRAGRAVVLTRGRHSEIADQLRTHRPGLTVTVVRAEKGAWVKAAGLGPLALLVDDTDDPRAAASRFRRHFLLLAEGGRYVAPRHLEAELKRLASRPDHPSEGEDSTERALAAAMGAVEDEKSWVAVSRVGRTVAKLRELETTEVIAADPGRGTVLSRLEAGSFDSRCAFREMLPLSSKVKQHYDAPPAVLRQYNDVACAPHGLVVQRGLVLADSFRHHPEKLLKHEKLLHVDGRHAVEPAWVSDDLPSLRGAWYHLDNENRGHFGHVLTEQLSRLWAWDDAVRREPEIRVLVAVNRKRTTLASWELQLLEAAGIERDRVTVVQGPVRVERLLGATPLFSMPFYVHPHITATWDRIGSSLLAQAPRRDYPRRIFCSRKVERRSCRNARDVDAFFEAHGFEVVFPEDFPLPEQVAMFHEAEVIAGFAGSALFTSMLTNRPKRLIAVASETYGPRNEYLISAVRGHQLDMSHSRPDESDPVFHTKRFQSSFTFDFEREGRWLEDEVFATLRS